MFVCLGFGFPALFDRAASGFDAVFRVTLFWFLAGALIGAVIRKTRAAIGVWLLVYIVSAAISIALFADMMN